ncbi:MAG: 50S ribosomal protein L3 [Candidatus Harrisonbacteria bacterium CG10_big_fil_rev_8_21_14_0_10_42_17]|uniref:Large ribosomal subunit protein uL3 n=1 Tax=Candidatus Harrisonbacteria bacterium CG10_big_fil_rev_8_21_14_0_10_42_17 TaxID=1974584 RepID=A0A2M6WHQ5_9BACT|nr:MAG: 50S ribosomal protein L3 [Candidatus Harrisonbacteria bacterium CG10_big_fil_rev_8_21_14_0_10_42_17]
METYIGTKAYMTQIYKDDRAFGVTVVTLQDPAAVGQFSVGEKVRVSATSKGKGFQGVVKRHNFAGGPKTHGQKHSHRAPGSIGNTALQRVPKGRRMAGRMGGDRVSVKNLNIAHIDAEKHVLLLVGAVPGNKQGRVEIRRVSATNQDA